MASRALFAVRVGTVVVLLTILVLMMEVDGYSISGGRRLKGDKQLLKNNTKVAAKIWPQENKACYPTALSTRVNITKFEVKDLMPSGRGGVPSLIHGGVNQTFICFLLRSSPHQAYNFTINLWGFRR